MQLSASRDSNYFSINYYNDRRNSYRETGGLRIGKNLKRTWTGNRERKVGEEDTSALKDVTNVHQGLLVTYITDKDADIEKVGSRYFEPPTIKYINVILVKTMSREMDYFQIYRNLLRSPYSNFAKPS